VVQKKTWIKLSDSSQAQWLSVFHLYGGFCRKKTSAGYFTKGSVRIIQPMADPYKGFTVKRINKGKVCMALISKHVSPYKHPSGWALKSKDNGGAVMKNKTTFLSDHILGPCFSSVRKKKLASLFRFFLYRVSMYNFKLPTRLSTIDLDFTYYTKFITAFKSKPTSALTGSDSISNLLDSFSVYHTTVPNIKLYYPEPFIATPTFIHDDIWFLHIVIYQYWLWFFFIFIIIFFFLVFIVTLRWCNIRHKPVRETRGVSRSKCGDLITAAVPISWATSIIIHESTDAIEFNDGFGSTEMAVGIRAYQWGWEYYYPKDLNLMLKGSELAYVGNSLKTDLTLGKSEDYYSWKGNSKSSDFNSHSTTSGFGQLLSLRSPVTAQICSNFNFGGNKLIARKASNLITSPKLLNLDNLYFNTSAQEPSLNAFKAQYAFYSFDVTFPSKPQFTNHQISFFSSLSNFQNALNFLNINDMRLAYNHASASTIALNNHFPSQFITEELTSVLKTTPNNFKTVGQLKLLNLFNSFYNITNTATLPFTLIADQDFKRWSANELLEESYWLTDFSYNVNNYYNEETLDSKHALSNLELDISVFTNLQQVATLKDLTVNELDYGIVANSNSSKLVLSNTTDSYLAVLPLRDWLSTALEANFNSCKLNTEVMTIGGYNALISFNPLLTKLSTIDLLTNYALQQSQPSLTYNNSLASNTIVDSVSMIKSLNTYYSAFWKVFKSTIE